MSSSSPTAGFLPADLQSAYQLPTAPAGFGQTVALVDAYDDPSAASDLAVYRSQFGLPHAPPQTAASERSNQFGGTTSLPSSVSWGQEISVDLDMGSAVCRDRHILLVEAQSASISDLGTAVNEAATAPLDYVVAGAQVLTINIK